jgi:predicted RNA binding protein YcfA (HicA-like mRNA interferase family)
VPKLHSSAEVEMVLRKLDFFLVSQKGSHGKFKHPSGKIVILPMGKREIPVGTMKSILRQMGISEEEFQKLLRE